MCECLGVRVCGFCVLPLVWGMRNWPESQTKTDKLIGKQFAEPISEHCLFNRGLRVLNLIMAI